MRSTHYNRGVFASILATLSLLFAPLTPAFAGVSAGGSLPSSKTVTVTASGSLIVPFWSTRAAFTLVGGGGSGGTGSLSNSGTGGTGGGGAMTVSGFSTGVTPNSTLTITIGAGGAAVSSGGATKGNPGGNTSLTGALTLVPTALGGGPGCAPITGTCDNGDTATAAAGTGGAGGRNVSTAASFATPVSGGPTGASVGQGNGLAPTNSNTLVSIWAMGSSGGGAPQSGNGTGGKSPCFDGTFVANGVSSGGGVSGGAAGGCSLYGKGGAGGNGSDTNTPTAGIIGTGYGGGGGGSGGSSGAGFANSGAGSPGVVIATFYP